MTDVVYLVRPGDHNDELRMSLRTLVNLPHDRVWLVGHRPSWVTGVEHIPGNRHTAKALNVLDNVRLACDHDAIADDIVVMNDDFFVLQPWAPQVYVRGTLAAHLELVANRNDSWAQSLRNTATWLDRHGIPAPLSYELHIPFPVERAKMADALAKAADFGGPHPPQWRTVYGAIHVGDAPQAADCKLRPRGDLAAALSGPLLSTTDSTFPQVAAALAGMFPAPSRYERS